MCVVLQLKKYLKQFIICYVYVAYVLFLMHMCGGQSVTRELFLSTLWVPGIELGLLGLTMRMLPTELFCLSPPIVRTFHHMQFTVCFVFYGDRNSWLHGQVVLGQ